MSFLIKEYIWCRVESLTKVFVQLRANQMRLKGDCKVKYALLHTIAAIYTFRFLVAGICFKCQIDSYFKYDLLMKYIVMPLAFDYIFFFTVVIALMPIFKLMYMLYRERNQLLWTLLNELIVLNGDKFFALNSRFKVNLDQKISLIFDELKRIYFTVKYAKHGKFANKELEHFKYLNEKNRIRLIFEVVKCNLTAGFQLCLTGNYKF